MPNGPVEILRETSRRIRAAKASAHVATIDATALDVRLSLNEGTTAPQICGTIFQVAEDGFARRQKGAATQVLQQAASLATWKPR